MSIFYINTGTGPNAGNGDPLRVAFNKINSNFSYLDQFSIPYQLVKNDKLFTLLPTGAVQLNAGGQIADYPLGLNDSLVVTPLPGGNSTLLSSVNYTNPQSSFSQMMWVSTTTNLNVVTIDNGFPTDAFNWAYVNFGGFFIGNFPQGTSTGTHYTWHFNNTGAIIFPDSTQQYTAYLGTLTNISTFNNDAGYLTSATFSNVGYVTSGSNVSVFNNDAGYLTSTSTLINQSFQLNLGPDGVVSLPQGGSLESDNYGGEVIRSAPNTGMTLLSTGRLNLPWSGMVWSEAESDVISGTGTQVWTWVDEKGMHVGTYPNPLTSWGNLWQFRMDGNLIFPDGSIQTSGTKDLLGPLQKTPALDAVQLRNTAYVSTTTFTFLTSLVSVQVGWLVCGYGLFNEPIDTVTYDGSYTNITIYDKAHTFEPGQFYYLSANPGTQTVIPANALGYLHNDGYGILTWETPSGGGASPPVVNNDNSFQSVVFVSTSGNLQTNASVTINPEMGQMNLNSIQFSNDNTTQTTAWNTTTAVVWPSQILGGVNNNIVQSNIAPEGTTSTLWYDTVSGRSYVYYNGAWVDANPETTVPTNISSFTNDRGYITSNLPGTFISTGLQVNGNAHITGSLEVDGPFTFSGTATVISVNSATFFGNQYGFGAFYAGVLGYTPLPYTVAQFTANYGDYSQINFQNLNNSATASTDWVATADNGSDSTNFIDLGIAGGNWDGTQANSLGTAVGADDGYLYVQGGTGGGNLILGATSLGKSVKILAGQTGAAGIVAQFNSGGLVLSTGTAITFSDGTQQTTAVNSSGTVVLETLNVTNVSATNITINGQAITAGVTRITAGTGTYVSTSTGALTIWVDTFNTGTLVTNSVFASTSGYALNFNTGTLVTNSVFASTSGYALNFNTGTLITQAVTALSIPYANVTGTPNLNIYALQSTVTNLSNSLSNFTTSTLVNGSYTASLSTAGVFTTPLLSVTSNATVQSLTVNGPALFNNSTNDIGAYLQSTGRIIWGGINQTGEIRIGQPTTVSQTINIANAAITTGNTQTINIGTQQNGGQARINIGNTTGTIVTVNGTVNVNNAAVITTATIGNYSANFNTGTLVAQAVSAQTVGTLTNLIINGQITTPVGSNANLLIDPDGTADVILTTSTQLIVYGTNTSVSTTTGAVIVSGGVGVGGTVTANKFVGDGSSLTNITVSQQANIVGVQPNVTLVAGNYSYLFDNTGTFTMPVDGDIVMPGTNSILAVNGTTLLGGATQVVGYYSTLGVKYPGGGTQYGMTLRPAADNTNAITFLNAAGTNIGSITQTTSTVQFNMPNRPAFRVYGAGTTSNLSTTQNTNGILNGNNFAVDYNQGTALSTSTGVFTAPVAGLYSIHLVARVTSNSAGQAQVTVIKNNGLGSQANQAMWETGPNPSVNHFGVSTIAKLAVGDTLVLKVTLGSINFDANDNWSVAYIG